MSKNPDIHRPALSGRIVSRLPPMAIVLAFLGLITLLLLASLTCRNAPLGPAVSEGERDTDTAQVRARSSLLLRQILPATGASLSLTIGRRRHYRNSRETQSQWQVEATDADGDTKATLAWDADSGNLRLISCTTPATLDETKDSPLETPSEAAAMARRWLRIVPPSGPWRLTAPPRRSLLNWTIYARRSGMRAILQIRRADGALVLLWLSPDP